MRILFPHYRTLEDLARENGLDPKYLFAARLFQQGHTKNGWIASSTKLAAAPGAIPGNYGAYRKYVVVNDEKIWEAYPGLDTSNSENISLACQVLADYDHKHAVESYLFMGRVGDYKLVIQMLLEQRHQRKLEDVHSVLYFYKGGDINKGNGLHFPKVGEWKLANSVVCVDPMTNEIIAIFKRAESVLELTTGMGRRRSTRLHTWKVGERIPDAFA